MDFVTITNSLDEPAEKKARITEWKSVKYYSVYSEHIHAVISVIDILEIGTREELPMDENIKLAELTVKYFFLSLVDSGKHSLWTLKTFLWVQTLIVFVNILQIQHFA